jgi:hypothetical protein
MEGQLQDLNQLGAVGEDLVPVHTSHLGRRRLGEKIQTAPVFCSLGHNYFSLFCYGKQKEAFLSDNIGLVTPAFQKCFPVWCLLTGEGNKRVSQSSRYEHRMMTSPRIVAEGSIVTPYPVPPHSTPLHLEIIKNNTTEMVRYSEANSEQGPNDSHFSPTLSPS